VGLLARIFGGGKKKISYPAELQPQIERAMNGLRALTSAHDGMFQIGRAQWSVDQEKGTITFNSPSGMRAEAPVQIIGTYNTQDGTWLWSWANSSIESPLTEDARKVQAYGQEHGYEILTTRKISCPEEQCWELAALACMLCQAQGAYRGPAGTARVFMTFGKVSLSKAT
jgi:hypothetical protein